MPKALNVTDPYFVVQLIVGAAGWAATRSSQQELNTEFHIRSFEKHQTLHLQIIVPVVIQGDFATLRQALMNLLDNAIRYTPAKGQIQLKIGHGPDGCPMVEVEDNGPGIPLEDRNRIFDRFYRSQSDCSKASRGTGLGLTIARSAVEANGGKLEYEDIPMGGSRFRMTFSIP